MFDVMLWIGISVSIATVALVLFLMTWSSGEVAQAQLWVQETAKATMGSYTSRQDFSLLTQSSALQDNLFPQAAYSNGQPTNPWGGDFSIAGVDTPTVPRGAADIAMTEVPSGDCVQLAAALATSADSITVDGTVVSTNHSPPDPNVTETACQTNGRLDFLYNKQV
jgi:hypothetical protein